MGTYSFHVVDTRTDEGKSVFMKCATRPFAVIETYKGSSYKGGSLKTRVIEKYETKAKAMARARYERNK